MIIACQITLLITSFLVLVQIESESLSLANSINVAGLNRFLTSNVLVEIYDSNYKEMAHVESLKKLHDNIMLLKNGGIYNETTIKELPLKFENEWMHVFQSYQTFENSIQNTVILDDQTKLSKIRTDVVTNGDVLIQHSNTLVNKIATFLEEKSILLIRLQVIFLIVNTVVHVLLLLLIFRILTKETDEKIRLERFATIGRMGATIAHDLRNPLTVIRGSCEILKIKKKLVDEFEEKQYEKIVNSIKKIEYLTRDILDFAETKELYKEKTSLLEIINKSILDVKLPEEIEVKLPESDLEISVDKIKIQTVITNLIKNSIDAIDGTGKIEFKIEEYGHNAILTVRDTGHGIPPKDLSRIFDPLYTTKQTGTGLGLASCKRIIEQHGGKIRVKINPTTFIILLPKE